MNIHSHVCSRPHLLGIRLSTGRSALRCPWHGWEFDLATGESRFDPRRHKTRAYRVTAEPAEDLRAETVPVRVEEDYVVVET